MDQGSGIRDQGNYCGFGAGATSQLPNFVEPHSLILAERRAALSVHRPRPMPVQCYRDLLVWQKSLRLARDVEHLATRLPVQQRFELASQLRKASSSIPFNIAEGSARSTKVYINHLLIALGSEAELQTELLYAANLNGVSQSEVEDLLDRASEIGRMLRGLVRSLRAHLAKRERKIDKS